MCASEHVESFRKLRRVEEFLHFGGERLLQVIDFDKVFQSFLLIVPQQIGL
jgi:hypothetical protein